MRVSLPLPKTEIVHRDKRRIRSHTWSAMEEGEEARRRKKGDEMGTYALNWSVNRSWDSKQINLLLCSSCNKRFDRVPVDP